MRRKSIRWRLTLSFAGIALLVALSSGAVLIMILQRYYAEREMDYLSRNALAISMDIAQMVEADLPSNALQAQVETLSFLSQTRVRLFGTEGQVLQDSGVPRETRVDSGVVRENVFLQRSTKDEAVGNYFKVIAFGSAAGDTASPLRRLYYDLPSAQDGEMAVVITLPTRRLVGTPYGFQLGADPSRGGERSHQVARHEMVDSAGKPLGWVELSEGPSYGRDVVNSVALGWGLASIVAVLLAAAVGWYVSRRISSPVLVLAGAASKMAAGDLTSRTNLEGQDEFGRLGRSFDEMADKVQSTVEALRRFVGDAAHEVQTPLTALRTDLELMADEPDRNSQLTLVRRAQSQVERLSILTSSLLDLSRIEGNDGEVDREEVDMVALLQETGETYASQAEQAGISFTLDLPAQGKMVLADRVRLRRALENLLDNAIKFTPEGGQVSLGLRESKGMAELWVQDNGIGIPPEDLPLLFARFHRGRNAAAYPGSGLGLAIVKAIVERQGGRVTAENTGNGACFSIFLPILSPS